MIKTINRRWVMIWSKNIEEIVMIFSDMKRDKAGINGASKKIRL